MKYFFKKKTFGTKTIALILSFLLTFSGSGSFISNAETNSGEAYLPTTKILYSVNPLYADQVSESDLYHGQGTKVTMSSVLADTAKATSEQEVAQSIKNALKNKDKNIYVNFELDGTAYDGKSLINLENDAFNAAMNHTGSGSEGDYLKWGYSGMGMQVAYDKKDGKTIGTFTFYMTYYTTAAQEQSVNSKVSQISSNLSLSQKSEYEKVCAVYDYVCKNVKYNYGSSLIKYTCYAAAVDNSAVCQGYALMMYRLLNDAGVSCRLVAGETSTGGHGWNIVKIGGSYYNIDATWDAGKEPGKYKYFLKSEADFTDHKRWSQYTSNEFLSAYPMSATSYSTGKVGSEVTVKSVSLNKDELTLNTGESGELTAKINPSNAQAKLVWKSSDNNIATVSSEGDVVAVAAGTCEITVSTQDGKFSDTCYVTVKGKAATVKTLKLNKKKIKLAKGKRYKLKAKINPVAAENTALVWKSSNKKVAKISKKGVVTAKGKGTCKITVMTKDGKKKATCKVTVK